MSYCDFCKIEHSSASCFHPGRADQPFARAADVETLREVLDAKTMWHMPGRSPLAGTYVGIDAVLDFMARVGELSDDLRADLIDVYVSERGALPQGVSRVPQLSAKPWRNAC